MGLDTTDFINFVEETKLKTKFSLWNSSVEEITQFLNKTNSIHRTIEETQRDLIGSTSKKYEVDNSLFLSY